MDDLKWGGRSESGGGRSKSRVDRAKSGSRKIIIKARVGDVDRNQNAVVGGICSLIGRLAHFTATF